MPCARSALVEVAGELGQLQVPPGGSSYGSQLLPPVLCHTAPTSQTHTIWGLLPAGVGLWARVFSLLKEADPVVSSLGNFRQRGLGPPREGGEMTQLFPQPCGAGSMVHSSMGAPGKGPGPAPLPEAQAAIWGFSCCAWTSSLAVVFAPFALYLSCSLLPTLGCAPSNSFPSPSTSDTWGLPFLPISAALF